VTRPQITLLLVIVVLGAVLLSMTATDHPDQISEEFSCDPPPRGYVCYRAKSAIVIDGKLDDAAWADAPWSEPFRDIEGDAQPEPPLRTRMKILWDDSALYIAAELEEPHVWATLREHDAVIFQDNDFEVFLNPDADSHLYAELELNALNTTWDLLLSKPYKDGGHAIDSWEITGLKTATQINGTLNDPRDVDRGWTVEIALPWQSIREISKCPVPPRDGDQWRINFSRVEWDMDIVAGKYQKVANRPEHNWVWSPQGTIDMHRPERWGILQFSTGAPGTTSLRPDPAQPARDYLHRIYYAQLERSKRREPYADSLAALGIPKRIPGAVLANPRLETTRHGFEASVELRKSDGKRERWRITNDAWIGKD
jgi:hypothetical protein